VPFAPPKLLILLESLGSNPTLSAILSEVWRILPFVLLKTAQIRANSLVFNLKPDWRKCSPRFVAGLLRRFSLMADWQSGFVSRTTANETRSESDPSAKAT